MGLPQCNGAWQEPLIEHSCLEDLEQQQPLCRLAAREEDGRVEPVEQRLRGGIRIIVSSAVAGSQR